MCIFTSTLPITQKGVDVQEDADARALRKKVEESCNIKEEERDEMFTYTYGEEDADGAPPHVIKLAGWKKELGQRLESTGLTMWRAGEDLARYLYEKRAELFHHGKGGRIILELGCGLGLVGLLASQLNPKGVVVLTDGDPVTMEKVRQAQESVYCVCLSVCHDSKKRAAAKCKGSCAISLWVVWHLCVCLSLSPSSLC